MILKSNSNRPIWSMLVGSCDGSPGRSYIYPTLDNFPPIVSTEKAFTREDGKEFDLVFNLAAETKYGQAEEVSKNGQFVKNLHS